MTGRETEMEQTPLPLWEYVPMGEYQTPEATMGHAIRGGIMGLWQRFRPDPKRAGDPLRAEEALQTLPKTTLDRIAPEPRWQSAAMALKANLISWINKEQEENPRVYVVAPPHGNNASRNLLCVADFYLRSPHDSAQVKQTLEDVGLTSSFLQLKSPVHVVVQEKPWGTHYRLKAYPVDPRDQFRFVTDLTIRGRAALTELGVKFAETSLLSQ